MIRKILAIALAIVIGLWITSVAIQTITINNLANKPEKPCPIILVNKTVNATKPATKNATVKPIVKPVFSIIYIEQNGCEFCAAQRPAIDAIAKNHDVTIINLTTDQGAPAIIKQYGIATTPTTIILKNGKEITRFTTVQSEATILGAMK